MQSSTFIHTPVGHKTINKGMQAEPTLAKAFNLSKLEEFSFLEFQTKETCTLPETGNPSSFKS